MTTVAWLPVFAGVMAFGCGGALQLGGTTQSDAAADIPGPDVPAVDAADLPYIEVDCTPSIVGIGRFLPQCYLEEAFFSGADSGVPLVSCERINDAGGWTGTIVVYLRRPQEIVIGQPMIVGGTDPGVSVAASSGSVIMALVQTIPGSDAGAIVIDAFEPGQMVRGHFVDVTFSTYPRPPTYPCRISNSEFVAQAPVMAN
jgi:hypothetical protein